MKENKYKVHFYIESLSIGGAERVTIYLADFFNNNNIDATIITNKFSEQEYSLSDKQIKRISLFDKNEKLNHFKKFIRLQSYITKEKPEVLIVMGSPQIIYAVPAVMGSLTKLIVSERNSPENFSGRKITKFLTQKLYPFSDGYIFQTKEVLSFYDEIDGPKKVIPNPLFMQTKPNTFGDRKEKKIVSVGRLNPQKNQKMLINAFSIIASDYPEYNLIIYGEGSERKQLETLIKRLKLENRIFLPGSTKNVLNKINNASVFAFSSDFEGMPNALIEAMALGLPVVSTDCPGGGPKELIRDGINGLLTLVGDEERLAEKLDYLLSNPIIANSLGNEAMKIKNKLDAEKIGNKWLDFTLKIITNQ